jgi:hypothetical protein
MADDNGINWKELSVDKTIDAILIPVGLFAALWFQGWVDAKKEKEDYGTLIGDFQTEFSNNRSKAQILEAEIGPLSKKDATDQEALLGPMYQKFESFKSDAERLSGYFDCIDLFFDATVRVPAIIGMLDEEEAPAGEAPAAADAPAVAPGDAPVDAPAVAPGDAAVDPMAAFPAEERAELEACEKVIGAFESETPKRFPGVDLSPFYQYVVWEVYKEDGIKLFKDPEAKRLGLKLGESYAAQREVENRVQEVERLFNDSMMRTSGELAGLVAESAELLPEDPDIEDLKSAQTRLQEMSSEAFSLRYEVDNIRNVVALKVSLLKDYIGRMHGQLDDTMKALGVEKERVAPATK